MLIPEVKGQDWFSGESCLTESLGHMFEAASPHSRGKAYFGLSLSQTLLVYEYWVSPILVPEVTSLFSVSQTCRFGS